jgi:hypothetical protein
MLLKSSNNKVKDVSIFKVAKKKMWDISLYIFVATYVKGMNGSECVETLSKAIPLGAIV